MSQPKVYFVTAGLADEMRVIRKVKPPRLLCSFWYFKNKPLDKFCEALGYQPEIMLDSGAYSAYTQHKNANLLDYMDYIRKNEAYISSYVALDVIGDNYLTKTFYEIMVTKGFDPVPVFHYGEDYSTLRYYQERGVKTVALGGTVPVRDKVTVAAWCNEVASHFPEITFHLLGSASPKILECESVVSCDSCAWYLLAINGKPKTIPGKSKGAKLARAEANMLRTMGVFNDLSVSDDDCDI